MYLLVPLLYILSHTGIGHCEDEEMPEIPEVDVPFDPNHKLLYRNHSTEEIHSFGHILNKVGGRSDFYYAMLGAVDDYSHTLMQFISFNSLNRLLQSLDSPSKASTINNDFKDSHKEEGDDFNFFGNEVHDFGELGVDFGLPSSKVGHNFKYLGIWVYAWNDCIEGINSAMESCVHVIQIRNYGENFPDTLAVEHLTPLFQWVEQDIHMQSFGTPIVVAFQHFNHDLLQITEVLQDIVTGFDRPINLLGVTFAMMDRNITVNKNICQPVGRFEKAVAGRTPVIVFGALPRYAYFMLQYSPFSRGLKSLYVADTAHRTETIITKIDIDKLPCIADVHSEYQPRVDL